MWWYCGVLFFISQVSTAQSVNQLSAAERKAGWQLLFDGIDTKGWRGAYMTEFPKTGWKVVDGELRGELTSGAEAGDAGDIVTMNTYRDFELVFDWKLGKGGNSGVKYFIEERQPNARYPAGTRPKPVGSQAGYEYQLIDDADYIYQGKHLPQDLKTGSIYDVVAADKPDVQVGVWHTSKLVVNKNHIEHWLDGKRVLSTDRTSDTFKKGVAESKFADYAGFARIPAGHILLQDHGHSVAFRTIKIRKLAP